MHISPSEIKSIKNMGTLHDEDVKLIATKGGLFLALGKKNKDKKGHEPLAAASHPALVIHQVEKQYKKDFQPALNKSEHEQMPQVTEFDSEIRGASVFSLKKNNELDIIIAKTGIELCKCSCEISDDCLTIKNVQYKSDMDLDMLKSELNKSIVRIAKAENIKTFK